MPPCVYYLVFYISGIASDLQKEATNSGPPALNIVINARPPQCLPACLLLLIPTGGGQRRETFGKLDLEFGAEYAWTQLKLCVWDRVVR